MKIKINEQNRAKIEAALEKVNGKARAHTITSHSELAELAERAEEALKASGLLLLKDRRGARLTFSPSGPGKAYAKKAFRVTTTSIVIERGPSGWLLTRAQRAEIPATLGEGFSMTISSGQADIIKSHAMKQYTIAA